MKVDYHLHTSRCGHARGTMHEYVLAAKARGLAEIGFADHIPIYWLPKEQGDPGLAMSFSELDEYISEVHVLRGEFPDIKIGLGIEADYIPGQEKKLEDFLSRYSFDYVLGAVHYVNGWGFDNPAYLFQYQHWDIDELYSRYFSLLQQAAATGLFDIMAHPDLIKKFGYRPRKNILPLYRETAGIFKKAGVYVEINTAGLRAPVREIYPHPDFLKECMAAGLKFTLGSDAHTPEQVGQDLEQALELVDQDQIARLNF